MKVEYKKTYSNILQREMEHKVFGDSGKVCFVFAPQNGRFFDFENFGMIDVSADWINNGKIQMICVDSIDTETWSNQEGNPRYRIELQEKWFHYVVDELFPMYLKQGEKAMVTGCSMGGAHSANFFFRRPDLIDTMVALSGVYNANFFIHDYMDDLIYNNSPIHFLPNMPDDHPYKKLYAESTIIACVGQGAWEDELLASTRELDTILTQKGIPHWFDYWGFDVAHDWCWWQKQLPYFLNKILN